MEQENKITEQKETNFIAVSSFVLAVFAWISSFISNECNWPSDSIGGIAAFLGLIGLIWLKAKNQKGDIYAYLGMLLGLAAFIILVNLC